MRPLGFQLTLHVLALSGGQATPLHFSDEQALGVLRIGRNQIQFDMMLPLALRTEETRSAKVFKYRRGVVMNEFVLERLVIRPPSALVR